MSGVGSPVPSSIELCPCHLVMSMRRHEKGVNIRKKDIRRNVCKESEEVGSKNRQKEE